MIYFAYGDTMHTSIFSEIINEFECLGVGKISGYKLYFHKQSGTDSSGKCNIVRVNDLTSEVYGVLYFIGTRDKYLLDKAEHLGYGNQETTVKVSLVSLCSKAKDFGTDIYAFTFSANKSHILEDLVPFSWYKDIILEGAKQHELPSDYIHRLEGYASQNDPNQERERYFRTLMES
jgi:gamma-glutamylcyclotransferase